MLFTTLYLPFPLDIPGLEDDPKWGQVALFNFDLSLETNEEIKIREAAFHFCPEVLFSCKAKVVKQEKIAEAHRTGGIFRIRVYLEIIDSEEIEHIRRELRRLKPLIFG